MGRIWEETSAGRKCWRERSGEHLSGLYHQRGGGHESGGRPQAPSLLFQGGGRVPSADDVPGGTLLTIPAEEVLEERVVRVPGDGEIRQVRVSPALISAQTAVPAEGNPVNLEVLREAPEIPAALPGRDGLGAGAGACLSERRTARLLCQRGRGRSADPELVPAGSPPGSGGSGGGGGERDPVSRRVGAEMPRRRTGKLYAARCFIVSGWTGRPAHLPGLKLSFRETARLNTRAPGLESLLSTQK